MVKKSSPRERVKSISFAFDLLDEAYFLLRSEFLQILPLHLLASIPFVLLSMFFIYRFEAFSSTDSDIILWACGLTLLFSLKNILHCKLSSKMLDIVSGRTQQEKGSGKTLSILFKQNIVHSSLLFFFVCLLELPWGFWMFVPFAIFIFPALIYTSDTISAQSPDLPFFIFWKKVYADMSVNFIQHMLMLIITLIGVGLISLNFLLIIVLFPYFMKTFLGVETQFSLMEGSIGMFYNSTLISILIFSVWMIVDPYYRALYVLRVFYTESIYKGWDIRSSLLKMSQETLKKTLLLVCVLSWLFSTMNMYAGENNSKQTVITKNQLEKSISKTLNKIEYQWRDLNGKNTPKASNWLSTYIKYNFDKYGKITSQKISDFIDYISKWFPDKKQEKVSKRPIWNALANFWYYGKFIIPIVIILIILYIIIRKYYLRKNQRQVDTRDLPKIPDLNEEHIAADELEEEEWMVLCRELMEKGEFRLALRAFYLRCIRTLAERKLLMVTRYKTDYEYVKELKRRAHSLPQVISVFEQRVMTFQQVWYGDYPVDQDTVQKYIADSKVLFPKENQEEKSGEQS